MNKLKVASSLIKIAKSLLSFNQVRFDKGDLVKYEGRSRNIFEVKEIDVRYSVIGSDEKTTFTIPHELIGKVFEFVKRPSGKKGYGDVGDYIVLKKNFARGEEGNEYKIRYVHVNYLLEGVNNNKKLTVEDYDLVSVDEAMLDKQKRGPVQAAEEDFGGKGGLVVIDMYRLTRQSVGKIIDIKPKGTLIVQQYGRKDTKKHEEYLPDFSDKMDKIRFTPDLFRGEWKWGNKKENLTIIKPYKGGSVTSLYD